MQQVHNKTGGNAQHGHPVQGLHYVLGSAALEVPCNAPLEAALAQGPSVMGLHHALVSVAMDPVMPFNVGLLIKRVSDCR